MDPIDRGSEVKGTSAERVAGTSSHESRQIRLARNHLGRRNPVGPFRLARDFQQPLPLEAFAADADAVAHRPVVALHDIEEALGGGHDDRARLFDAAVEDKLPLKLGWQVLFLRSGLVTRLLLDRHLVLWRRDLRLRGRQARSNRYQHYKPEPHDHPPLNAS